MSLQNLSDLELEGSVSLKPKSTMVVRMVARLGCGSRYTLVNVKPPTLLSVGDKAFALVSSASSPGNAMASPKDTRPHSVNHSSPVLRTCSSSHQSSELCWGIYDPICVFLFVCTFPTPVTLCRTQAILSINSETPKNCVEFNLSQWTLLFPQQ